MFCWLKQWRISSALDDGRGILVGLRRHAMRCDHCREFLEGSRHLEIVLRGEAKTPHRPVPRFAPTPTWKRWASLAAAAAIVVAVTWLWHGTGQEPAPSPSPSLIVQPSPLEKLDASFAMLPDLANRSLAMIQETSAEPVRRELNGLSRDAKAIARTLVSYLPRMPQRSAPEGG